MKFNIKLKEIEIGQGKLSITIKSKFNKLSMKQIEKNFKNNEAYLGCYLTLNKDIKIDFMILDYVRDIEPYIKYTKEDD